MQIDNAHIEKVRKQFSQRIPTYEKAANWMLSRELLVAQEQMAGKPVSENAECLDVCCGTGIVGRNLLSHGWRVTGIDATPEMAEVAAKYYPTSVGAAESMPFASNRFDLVTLRQSFMLTDGEKVLDEIFRVLKPGGRFLLIQSVAFSEKDNAVYEKVQWARHINMKRYDRAEDLEASFLRAGFGKIQKEFLRIRESVDHWLESAPELSSEIRSNIREIILAAPDSYKSERNVGIDKGKLLEDWNWLLICGKKP